MILQHAIAKHINPTNSLLNPLFVNVHGEFLYNLSDDIWFSKNTKSSCYEMTVLNTRTRWYLGTVPIKGYRVNENCT